MVTLKEKNRNINTANQSTGELGLCCCPVTQGTLQHPQGMGRVCIPGTQLASLAGWTRVGAVHCVTAWGNVTICSSHPKLLGSTVGQQDCALPHQGHRCLLIVCICHLRALCVSL